MINRNRMALIAATALLGGLAVSAGRTVDQEHEDRKPSEPAPDVKAQEQQLSRQQRRAMDKRVRKMARDMIHRHKRGRR